MITLERLKSLKRGDVICIPNQTTAQGKPMDRPVRWKVNGKVQTWKRSPERVRVPVKHGLYAYDAITENELGYLNKQGAYMEGDK